MSDVKKKITSPDRADAWRRAVSGLSDDQRAELVSQLRQAGILRELVESDLALAWRVNAGLAAARFARGVEIAACDHKFVDSRVCLKCGVHVETLSGTFAPPSESR